MERNREKILIFFKDKYNVLNRTLSLNLVQMLGYQSSLDHRDLFKSVEGLILFEFDCLFFDWVFPVRFKSCFRKKMYISETLYELITFLYEDY